MKLKFFTYCLVILISNVGIGQTFSASPGAAISSLATTTSDISVTGVGTIDCSYGLTEVCVDITHTWDSDLEIFLIDPSGTVYELSTDNGGSGDDYSVTCFDMTAATDITAGTAPFNGSYVPEGGDLDAANDVGLDADGTWTLSVYDDASGDVGTLNDWSLTFDNDPPCPPPPTAEDCLGATTVCSDATFSGNSSGSGTQDDLDASNEGCLNGENQSSWYYFSAATGGTIEFSINTTVDYDFALWGPYTSATLECPPAGSPLRCSYSGTSGNTGLAIGSGDNTEGAGGDAWVDPITAAAGDAYILVIDNFTSDGSSFTLDWTLSGGASLDCTILPIAFGDFYGEHTSSGENLLIWSTMSEVDNSHFLLQRRTDETVWETIDQVPGAGNSSQKVVYKTVDRNFSEALNYYRLVQIDFNGEETVYSTISIDNRTNKEILKVVNSTGQEVSDDYKGFVIIYYEDGSVRKTIR